MSSFVQSQYDGLAADIRMQRLRGEALQQQAEYAFRIGFLEAQLEKANGSLDDIEGYNAGNLAIRMALAAALESLDPSHPLVKDEQLRQRIFAAGKTALKVTEDWDACREAGRTFALPPHTPQILADLAASKSQTQTLEARLAALEEEATRLRESTATLLAERTVLTERVTNLSVDLGRAQQRAGQIEGLTRDCAHHMAQSAAFRAQLEIADPENPLIVDASLRRRLADHAYDALLRIGEWRVVREVGRTFLRPARPTETQPDESREPFDQVEQVEPPDVLPEDFVDPNATLREVSPETSPESESLLDPGETGRMNDVGAA